MFSWSKRHAPFKKKLIVTFGVQTIFGLGLALDGLITAFVATANGQSPWTHGDKFEVCPRRRFETRLIANGTR